jgi:hypothetical protein
MKTISKSVILRGLVGVLIGIGISYLVSFFYSVLSGSENFSPVSPYLIEKYGSEMSAVTVQLICSAAIGFVFAGATVIFEFDSWSILKQTIVHFLILSTAFIPAAWFCWWVDHTVRSLAVFCFVFIVIYAVMWIGQEIAGQQKIHSINDKLNRHHQ